jgi:arylsulfatase A-like enzyme
MRSKRLRLFRLRHFDDAVLSALAFALTTALPLGSPASDPRGNVLILLADDLGLDYLRAYGWRDAPPTPNIDGLVAEGVRFVNAWAQPTCSPSRAAIQTGRCGFRTGIGTVVNVYGGGPALPLAEVTLPEMLDLGTGGAYAHALIGKWHLGSSQVGGDLAPNFAGYEHFAGSVEGEIERYDHWRRVVDGVAGYTSKYATTACVDDALPWIHAQTRPWLCFVSFQAPHTPFHRPPNGLYTESLPATAPRLNCNAAGGDPLPFYRATIEALDKEIGRLLAGLPPGQRERTTIFFLGDNGTESCVARAPTTNRAKGTLYESGVRVPLVVSGYRVTARGPCLALASATDVFASVAELAGVDLAATLPGVVLDSKSLVPCFSDKKQRVREWLYAETFTPNGPQNPPLQAPCPAAPVCQTSLGFDGPGNAELSSCGSPLYGLYGANVIPWQLTGAPPNANAWLMIGPYAPAFSSSYWATLVSPTPSYVEFHQTGTDGTLAGSTWTGSTTRELHYQFVVQDASQPHGYTVTNALRMECLETDMRAVRRARYKLIRFDPCHEELYDLALDPFERKNLLARALTPGELKALGRLRATLDDLR